MNLLCWIYNLFSPLTKIGFIFEVHDAGKDLAIPCTIDINDKCYN